MNPRVSHTDSALVRKDPATHVFWYSGAPLVVSLGPDSEILMFIWPLGFLPTLGSTVLAEDAAGML